MRQACEQMCQWQQAGVVLSFVAVNVSSRLFARRELFGQVAKVLRETGLDPACLELEVTESAVMDDPEVALEQMHRLRELGVRLAIDDFGTGYSRCCASSECRYRNSRSIRASLQGCRGMRMTRRLCG